jgi:hypothetical protein
MPMMQRSRGGTQDGKHAMIAQEPVGRMGTPDEVAAAVVHCPLVMINFNLFDLYLLIWVSTYDFQKDTKGH